MMRLSSASGPASRTSLDSTATADYYINPLDSAAGSIKIFAETYDSTGICTPIYDTITIIFTAVPTVTISSTSICTDDGGVFLYATRGAKTHLTDLFTPNDLRLVNFDLVIEHQANFAMIPLTLAQVLDEKPQQIKSAVADMLANKMVTNVHERGNCSVVCMQRLPYDLQRGALQADEIQGFKINRNLDRLRQAKMILNDSVGAGMTRSSFIQKIS